MLLKDFYRDHYKPNRLFGKSKNTFRLYDVCLRHIARSLGREAKLEDLNDATIKSHLQRLMDEGRSKGTVNKERCSIVAMWRYACKKGLLKDWPDVPKQVEPARTPMAWTHDDITLLLGACKGTSGFIGDTPAWLFWTALVRVCLDTGERIGALTSCKWNWMEGDSINIKAEVRKGSKRDKWFQLSEETAELLTELRKYRQSEIIFHWPYCETYLWNRYTKILERAGLPTGRKCGMHRLRKTTASVAFQAGLDPQELLDHSDRRTTQRYLDPRFTRDQQPSDILANWLKNPPKPEHRRKRG